MTNNKTVMKRNISITITTILIQNEDTKQEIIKILCWNFRGRKLKERERKFKIIFNKTMIYQ